jgi:hypothetical protein
MVSVFGAFGNMSRPASPTKPDAGIFTGIFGLLLGVLIPILQMNGLEISWEWSLVAYVMIAVGFTWTYLTHLVPHCGKIIKIFGSLILVMVMGYFAWIGTHSQYLKEHPKVPMLNVTIQTILGLPVGMENESHLRYHVIRIQNPNDVEINNFWGRLQLPEPIDIATETDLPPGTVIDWKPELTKHSVVGTGNQKILGPNSTLYNLSYPPPFSIQHNSAQLSRFTDGSDETGIWQLMLDKLPAHTGMALSFLTTDVGDPRIILR